MGQLENSVWKKTVLALSKVPGLRIFRNNVGQAWAGNGRRMTPGEVYVARGGERLIFNPRPVSFGLFKGSADGIGWVPVVVTEKMVGKTLAIFLSVETKAGLGKQSTEQKTWQEVVTQFGGVSIVASDPDLAKKQISEFIAKNT